MEIETFLEMRPTWAMEPCLYIVKQMFDGNNAYRCGASGTHLFRGADLVYGAENAKLTGLLGRMSMYKNYWLPLKGRIYAALRVRKALVAAAHHRVGEDALGNAYNISKGNHTLVLQREADFHAELDRRGLRWQQDKKNELFSPPRSVNELVGAMRTVQGEEMYLFDKLTIVEDTAYRGGGRRSSAAITTGRRALPERTSKDTTPTLHIRLSAQALEQLRNNDPIQFGLLVDLVNKLTRKDAAAEIRMSSAEVDALRRGDKEAARRIHPRTSRSGCGSGRGG